MMRIRPDVKKLLKTHTFEESDYDMKSLSFLYRNKKTGNDFYMEVEFGDLWFSIERDNIIIEYDKLKVKEKSLYDEYGEELDLVKHGYDFNKKQIEELIQHVLHEEVYEDYVKWYAPKDMVDYVTREMTMYDYGFSPRDFM